ncbi:MAG TPA: DegT/DnrJ/EryC1/StrS aminotransferase family protein [Verrucomicrobiae bacterium]|nr:DegT/DnrJ/EryC1/StrS aminotransferase family protein [Verrucomicrobiae bacterium]
MRLAAEDGRRARAAPFAPWPFFAEDEIDAATKVLRSGKVNYWTGDECRQFEQEYAAFTQTRYAVALANGTVALEAALHGIGIGPNDEVIVPSRTFIASASCVALCGARPVVADIDVHSQTLTAETVRAALTPRTKAILAVHLAGWPCDMDPLHDLAQAHQLFVIEDCAQAHGASYKGKPVGSLGDVGAFSFCQDKIVTTGGEGGMLVTNNKHIWRRAWELKDHGKNFDKLVDSKQSTRFRWVHDSFGTNWRMTEIQAALGRVALRKLVGWVEQRRSFAAILDARFAHIRGLRVTIPPADFVHSYYKYHAFVRPETLSRGWDRDRVVDAIRAEGVPCYPGTCAEIYLEKAFPDAWRPETRLPTARLLGETSLMFLVHPTLTIVDIEETANAVEKVMAKATAGECE